MSNLNGMDNFEANCSLVHDAVVSGDIQIVLCCIASTRMKRRRKEKKKEKKNHYFDLDQYKLIN